MDLLILDDFGFRRLETKEAELFYTLVDERLGNGSTIVTSNRGVKWKT
jgi:DNA replication protein DnaC